MLNIKNSTICKKCLQKKLEFSKMALRWRRGDELLNKVFIFFEYKCFLVAS